MLLATIGLLASGQAFAQAATGDGPVRLRLSDELTSLPDRVRPSDSPSVDAGTPESAGNSQRAGSSQGSRRGQLRGLRTALKLTQAFDDNVFRARTRKRSDWFRDVEPSAALQGAFGRHRFELSYKGVRRDWATLTGEDFTDHEFGGALDLRLQRKVQLKLTAGYELGHDGRGDILSRQVITPEPDLWGLHDFSGEIIVGRRIAKAQIGFQYALDGLRYFNNNQTIRDRDRRALRLRGRWNFSPRFAALAELGSAFTDYSDPASDLDSREDEVQVGLAWEATAKTSGEVKVGILNQGFDTSNRSSLHSTSWDSTVTYTPKPHSKWTLSAKREAQASATAGSGLISDSYGLNWRHAFSDRWVLDSGGNLALSEVDGGTDSTMVLSTNLTYQLRHWLEIGTYYEFSRRDSVNDALEYHDHIISFSLNATFDASRGRDAGVAVSDP